MTIMVDTDNSLLRNLREISARQKISSDLSGHLEQYFANADVAGIGEASPEELHGAAVQHHRLGQSRLPGQAVIAFYTPDFDRHGWHSAHTIVDIVTDDMPFLIDSITMLIYHQGLTIHRLMHPLLGVERDASGKLLRSAGLGSVGT
ncbi:MAG: NAD-glutamate dehydrogenase [Propionivibrio sp.]|uniref:NAD-glutamate dehydrogenase n=1 Tax=Candidatus Propionivibrio dominans TaxID=2954373 RepID=A0A9D7FBP9_9RHOO|nr:NAD-glutamate dehydrogenase [Candidatus Propionivibrio dominans]